MTAIAEGPVDYFRSTLSYAFSFFAGAFIFEFLSARSLTLDAALAHVGPSPRILATALFILASVLFAFYPYPVFKPLVGILSLVPVAIFARQLACLPSPFPAVLSFVGQSTLVIYCFDFSITPMTIWRLSNLNRAGVISAPMLVLLTFLYVPVFIALFCFLRFVWLENMSGKK